MNFADNIKSGLEFLSETVTEIASSIAEKNRLRVQLSSIKSLIKTDTATRDQAFIELGRYYYENLRDAATAENEAICAVVDAANDRISKASMKYVELLNIQNDTKIRSENAEKLAKAVSDKAADAAKAARDKSVATFDKAMDFAGIEIMWNNGSARIAYFDILVSDDGENWTDVVVKTDYQATVDAQVFEFDAVTGKYVRLQMEKLTHFVKLTEFEVYNIEKETPPPTNEDPVIPDPVPTGDGMIIGTAVLAIVSLAGATIVANKRKNSND
jgi:hypothetical protein